jgi:hypothetical protein
MAPIDSPRTWKIQEQIVEDPASGLVFQFEVLPHGQFALRVFGDVPFGNREIIFNRDGREMCAGTALAGPAKPTWLCQIEP